MISVVRIIIFRLKLQRPPQPRSRSALLVGAREQRDITMAAKPPYENHDEIFEDLDRLLSEIAGHPVDWAINELGGTDKKKAFANSTVKILIDVDPEFPIVCTKEINLSRALQVEAGDPGIAHVLMLGIDKVANSMMDVWWHGKGPPEKLIKWLKRSWREGLDTTQRSLKLCVGRATCAGSVADKLMFAGYGGGSTLGAAQTVGMLLFLQLPKELRATPGPKRGPGSPGPGLGRGGRGGLRAPQPGPLPGHPAKQPEPGSRAQDGRELLKPWLRSIARMRVTWVVYNNGMDRVFDGISSAGKWRG